MVEILFARKEAMDGFVDAPFVVAATSDALANEFLASTTDSIIVDASSPGFINWQRAALTGDVTAAQDSNATTIAASAVSNAKLANMAASTIKGRAAGAGTGVPQDLTEAQVKTIQGFAIVSTDNGLVRYDGTTGNQKNTTNVLLTNSGVLHSAVDGTAVLGSTTLGWGGLHMSAGAAINWVNGGGTITYNSGPDTMVFAAAAGGYFFSTTIFPSSDGAGNLGAGTTAFGNLFLNTGGKIDFENGDVTITHGAAGSGSLSFAGATSGYIFDSAVVPVTNDAAGLGSNTLGWSDLDLASGGIIRWANAYTITHSASLLTLNNSLTLSAGTLTAPILSITGNTTLGDASGDTVIVNAKSLTRPNMPAFGAYVSSASIANVTGDNTAYTIVFDTELYDRGGDHATGTGIFTAPITGLYRFSGAVTFGGIAAHLDAKIHLVTSDKTYLLWSFQPTNLSVGGTVGNVPFSIATNMSATHTASLTLTVTGGAGGKVVDIIGGTAPYATHWQGEMIG